MQWYSFFGRDTRQGNRIRRSEKAIKNREAHRYILNDRNGNYFLWGEHRIIITAHSDGRIVSIDEIALFKASIIIARNTRSRNRSLPNGSSAFPELH